MKRLDCITITVAFLLCACGEAGPNDPWLSAPLGSAEVNPGDCGDCLAAQGALYIVHPSRTWDPLALAEPVINEVLDRWVQSELPVHVLRHDDARIFRPEGSDRWWSLGHGSWVYSTAPNSGMIYPEGLDSYYIHPRPGVVFVESEDGEHQIESQATDLTFVGGYLHRCLARAVGWSIIHHMESNEASRLRIQIYLPGVFFFTRGAPESPVDIRDIWPYPVNPGFVYLHQQVGIRDTCPSLTEISENWIDNRDDHEVLGGAPTPPNLTLSLTCDGADLGEIEIGQGSARVGINFVTSRDQAD